MPAPLRTLAAALLLAATPHPSPRSEAGETPAAPLEGPATDRALEVVSTRRSPPLDGDVLDLAVVGDDRLLMLSAESLSLHRFDGADFSLASRQDLPGPFATVRAPGGILFVADPELSVWALTSRSAAAALFAIEGDALERRADALALPVPGVPGGVRFRTGTNLLDGAFPGLGPGPFLRAHGGGMAVSAEAQLLLAGPEGPVATGVRVGSALTALGPGLFAAASPSPPGSPDAILVIARDEEGARLVQTLPVGGSIRALASRVDRGATELVAAIEDGGRTHLLVLDVRPASR